MEGGYKLPQVTFRLEAACGSGHRGTHWVGRSSLSLPSSSKTYVPVISSSSYIRGPSNLCISQVSAWACPELCHWDSVSPSVPMKARGPGDLIPAPHSEQAAHQDAHSGRGARTSLLTSHTTGVQSGIHPCS